MVLPRSLRSRPYWRCYYANTDGIVFVVDSADVDRAGTAKAELLSMLQEEELKGVPLLVLANKQVRLMWGSVRVAQG